MINCMAANSNMTGSYCLSKKSYVSHHIIIAVDASFQFVDVRNLGTIGLLLINVKKK